MAKEPEGVVYSSKRPNPKPSPKNFEWPSREEVTDDQRKAVAASLQELLPTREWKHTDLTIALFGRNEAGAIRRVAIPRAWLRGAGPFLTEDEAAWTADLLGVSMARLLEPKAEFDPNSSLIRKWSPKGQGQSKSAKRAYVKQGKGKAVNDAPDDHRWLLPKGVNAPHLVMTTLEDRPGFASVELKATLPDDVAQAVYSMMKCKRPEE